MATDGGAGVPEVQGASEKQVTAATRASDRERDTVVQRVQDAFAEGRLDDTEFDERTRAAVATTALTIRPAASAVPSRRACDDGRRDLDSPGC